MNKAHSLLWIKAQKPLVAQECGSWESHRGSVRAMVARFLGGSQIKGWGHKRKTKHICQFHNLVQGCLLVIQGTLHYSDIWTTSPSAATTLNPE